MAIGLVVGLDTGLNLENVILSQLFSLFEDFCGFFTLYETHVGDKILCFETRIGLGFV
jgi:hypothetical protein